MASGLASHKDTSTSRFALLKVYYSSRPVMALFCVGQEAYYLITYAQKTASLAAASASLPFWPPSPSALEMALLVSLPFFALKQLCNVLQLVDALQSLAEDDAQTRNAGRGKSQ
jgi:CDP-diacylglycerol--inositol 3-phosphatidyltransferase